MTYLKVRISSRSSGSKRANFSARRSFAESEVALGAASSSLLSELLLDDGELRLLALEMVLRLGLDDRLLEVDDEDEEEEDEEEEQEDEVEQDDREDIRSGRRRGGSCGRGRCGGL